MFSCAQQIVTMVCWQQWEISCLSSGKVDKGILCERILREECAIHKPCMFSVIHELTGSPSLTVGEQVFLNPLVCLQHVGKSAFVLSRMSNIKNQIKGWTCGQMIQNIGILWSLSFCTFIRVTMGGWKSFHVRSENLQKEC